MPDDLNLIRNATLTEGARSPRGWRWSTDNDEISWSRCEVADGAKGEIVIESATQEGTGVFSQRVRCNAGYWYRIEAVVTCDCSGDDERAGAAIWVEPVVGREPTGREVHLTGVLRTAGPTTLRAYYRAPDKNTSTEIRIGLCGARGSMTVHSVLVIPTAEPEVTSHPMALPPPPHAYPAPKIARRVCVCGDTDEGGPLVAILETCYGVQAVTYRRFRDPGVASLACDALIITGDRPPTGVRSLSALTRLAADRLVVVSLPAFVKIAGRGLMVRTIDQPDDPLCAQVSRANFITRGFALLDVFPWATTAADPRVHRQHHLRKGAAMTALCKQHGFEIVLRSATDADATSDHPICLYQPIAGGGIIVCDTSPVETLSSTAEESNIAAFVLLNMLGADQASLGQYTVPCERQDHWHSLLKEFAIRYPMFQVTDGEGRPTIVELGTTQGPMATAHDRRPLILIRTGLRGDDLAGVYGTLFYLKQLVRPDPYETPYARALFGRFRVAWIPMLVPWQGRHWSDLPAGTSSLNQRPFDWDNVGAVIDITNSRLREVRVVREHDEPALAGYADQLAKLAKRFSAGRYFYRAGETRQSHGRRDSLSWRWEKFTPSVAVQPELFDSGFHRSAAAQGADLIRIELPDSNTDFTCNSIWRTDLAATMLEHVIGLQFGLLAMNRRAKPVRYPGYPPIAPGQALEVDAQDDRSLRAARAG